MAERDLLAGIIAIACRDARLTGREAERHNFMVKHRAPEIDRHAPPMTLFDGEGRIRGYVYNARAHARAWLASESDGPGTFVRYCEMLDLAPGPIRNKVLYGR